MNRSNHSSENDKKVVCWSTYHKRYYAANRERILARQKRWRTENSEVLKARRKRWYENSKERIVRNQRAYCQQNKEHVRSYRRKYDKDNRERLNKYWRSYYAKNKERIKQRLRDKKQQTEIGQTVAHCGDLDQGAEKLETSLAPSATQCGIPTSETSSTTATCENLKKGWEAQD